MSSVIGTITANGPGNITTGNLDTTGATLIVAYLGYYALGSTPAISDSKGNTWTALTNITTGVSGSGRMYYAQNPTAGSGHSFSCNTSVANSLIVIAISGTLTSSVFDTEGAGDVQNAIASQSFPGPLTTTTADSIVITGLSWELDGGSPTTPGINESYTVTNAIAFVNSDHFGAALAYKIFSSASVTTDPVWNYAGMNGRNVSSIASFLSSGTAPTFLFPDTITLSDSVSISVTGALNTGILITDNFISLIDSIAGNFSVQPPAHRGNIDYDQIRVAARSGPGSKLLTTTGSNTDGHGVIFSGGDLIDSGSAPGGGGTWGSITGTLSSQTDLQSALDAKLDDSQLDTDGTLAANSDSKIASQKATKTYVDAHSGSAGALILLEQHTASSSASLSFTTCITSSYDEYWIEFISLLPATDGTDLRLQFSTNGGSSYDSGANYRSLDFYKYTGGFNIGTNANTYSRIVAESSNSATYGGICGHLTLFNPLSSAGYKLLSGPMVYTQSTISNDVIQRDIFCRYGVSTAVNAFQLFMSSGNITSGTIRVYGVAK